MALKLFLNVIYTIGILISLYTVYWGYTNSQYVYLLGGLLIATIFVVLKIQLVKQVRAMEKPIKK
ncbi:DUF6358 family protein [Mucilaginibacter terrae]|uniref:DUF6358 family protein n=1 Tax=Mucilaginibacter terrae TaxID=1955052 RepID=UPI003632D9A0